MINIIIKKILLEKILIKNGNMRTNSTSKIIKIIEIRKKRKVKGKRALNLGLNPHSNGLIFSIINTFFFLNSLPNLNTSIDKIREIVNTTIKYIIN